MSYPYQRFVFELNELRNLPFDTCLPRPPRPAKKKRHYVIKFQNYSLPTAALARDYVNMDTSVVHMFSNVLSALTIASCLFLKVPQILYIREKQSAEGIYIQAMLMEITGFTIVTLYNWTNNYSLLTYLEYPIILVQIYVMLYYVLKFKPPLSGPGALVPAALVGYVTLVLAFAMQMLPKYLLSYMLPFCTPLSGFAKVTYMYGIVRARNADAVSLTTWLISISTNLARLFTVYVDSGDATLMFNFTVSAALSGGVLLTALRYQQSPPSPPPPPPPTKRRRSRRASRDHDD